MKHFTSFCFCFLAAFIFSQNIFAQDTSIYNKNEVFDPTFLARGGTEFRSADGAPGLNIGKTAPIIRSMQRWMKKILH